MKHVKKLPDQQKSLRSRQRTGMFDVEAVKLAARSNGYEDGTCEQKNIADHGSKASKQRPKMSFLQNHEKSREILLLDVCHMSWCLSRGPYCGATQPRHVGRYQPFAAVQMLPRRSLMWSPNPCGRSQRCGMAAKIRMEASTILIINFFQWNWIDRWVM